MVRAATPQPGHASSWIHAMFALITPAYAQDAAGLLGPATQFAPILLVVVVFYFLLFRPQQQQQKRLKAALAALKRGDRVVTSGGILATVQKLREGTNEVEVEIAPNVRVMVLRDTINTVLTSTAANDAKPAKTAG